MAKKKRRKNSGSGKDRSKSGATKKRTNKIFDLGYDETSGRLKFKSLDNDFKSGVNQFLNKYPYVICCGSKDIVHTHGCYEDELQNEYHWICEQVYSRVQGFPVTLLNSSHPSNKVCPQELIMKGINLAKKKNKNCANFEGGQYDFMIIVFEPFDDAIIVQKKDSSSHKSGGRGKDLRDRMEHHKRTDQEIWWYPSQKGWYGKVNGKIVRIGRNYDRAIEEVA